MRHKVLSALLLLSILIPSAQFAYRNLDMPQFAYLHDDGLLFVSAKSLADGNGYRIASLPENPHQTKYPPLFPLFLSVIWRLNPHFPDNLRLATVMSWAVLAVCLLLAHRLYRSDGFSEPQSWLLAGLLGLSPYMILFGTMMFSEVFFTCFVLACLLLARREGDVSILLAGLAGACAFLARTAGIALLISVPLWLAWRKRDWRRAALFAAAMLPAVIGWALWSGMHHLPRPDLTLIYYTDYIGWLSENVNLRNLTLVLWKNTGQIVYSMGALVLPRIFEAPPVKVLTEVIGVAMIAGVIRLARRNVGADYALFALVSALILVVWNHPPNERFVLPLFPLLLAGLLSEAGHLCAMLRAAFRHTQLSQRVVAAVFSSLLVAIALAAVAMQFYMSFNYMLELAQNERAKLQTRLAAYRWISQNLPPDAAVLSYDDALLYLYTGRRGNYLPLLTRWWYDEDRDAKLNAYRNLSAYCRSRRLEYAYFTDFDLSRETGGEEQQEILKATRSNAALTPLFTSGGGTVFRVN
jgi:hypothetical protein